MIIFLCEKLKTSTTLPQFKRIEIRTVFLGNAINSDSTWSNEILSSMNPKALFIRSVMSNAVSGLSLAKISASIWDIR
jgi:hypothetical protein